MKKYKISDIAVFEREWSEEKLLVLSENDHLLRRFGQIVLYKFKVDEISKEYLNETEDEIWTLTMGNGKLTLTDEREGSPSFGERVEIVLNENEPKSVLIPFGLKYRFLAEQESKIIIVRTKQERS